jgi:hypothetical protein
MRPLRYSINVTLDGCCDHRAIPAGEDLHRHAVENVNQADALLFGRVTYEMMESAWRPPAPTGARPDWMEPFAQTINAAKKYVVSSTLEQVDWNAELVRGDLAKAGEQWQHHRGIAGLARGEQDDQPAATAVDRGVDLGAQPAARPAESVIARFVPAARILVIRPSPYVLFEPRTILPNNTFGGGRVLMRPHDRGIDRHRPIDPASSIGLGLDHSQQHVPGPVGSETMMPLPHRLPRAEPLGKITPRHPGAITEKTIPSTTW